MAHNEESVLAGEQVRLRNGLLPVYLESQDRYLTLSEKTLWVDDWWDRIRGENWSESTDKLAIAYSVRAVLDNLPVDEHVLLGKVDGHEVLVHVTEIDDL